MQSAQDILDVLEKWAAEKKPIDPTAYIEAAQKLTLLLGDEADKLYQMEQNVALLRVELLDGGLNATQAKLRIEATDAYREARQQKAKIGRIEETVRLAKLRGRLASEEMRNQ